MRGSVKGGAEPERVEKKLSLITFLVIFEGPSKIDTFCVGSTSNQVFKIAIGLNVKLVILQGVHYKFQLGASRISRL